MGRVLEFEERLTRHVELDGDCWIWTGGRTRARSSPYPGYGMLRVMGRTMTAHRWVWQHLVGPIADGHELDHYACHRTLCVNPDHLEPVTPDVNFDRSFAPPRLNRAKTHCPHGHPYDEENTYVLPNGGRDCKICINRRSRERDARRRKAGRPRRG